MDKQYKLTLTSKQKEVVSLSCLTYGGIIRGDLTAAFSCLPYAEGYEWSHVMAIIDSLTLSLPEFLIDDCDGFATHLPIDHPSLKGDAALAFDLAELFSNLSLDCLSFNLTQREAFTVSRACDVYSRTLMGQIRELIDNLPLKKGVDYGKIWKIKEFLRGVMPNVLIHGIDGCSSSLGVGSPDLHENSNIAVDIHQVIRHKLSWEQAVKDGTIESEQSPRKWPEMIQVYFDDPFHWGSEPLCSITNAEIPSNL